MSDADTYTAIVPALVAAGVVWALLRLATRAVDRFAARLERDGVLDEGAVFAKRLTRFVRSTLWFVVLLVGGLVMLRGIGVRGIPRISAEDLTAWLIGPGVRLMVIATSAYLVTRCIHFLIDSLKIFLVSRDASQIDLLERKKRVDTLGQLLRVVATLVVMGVATLMALSLFSVDIHPILTGAGIAGLAVGFGAQNLVRDVIAAFFVILEDQVRLGDVVSINGKSGLVEAIRLRTIALRGHDGTVHIFPNGVITELSNMTKDFSFAVEPLEVMGIDSFGEARWC
jgi:small-conductance mechanosensitive channel